MDNSFLVLFVFYARQKPEKTRRAQKPNSLPLKTHYPLCLFMTFHLKRSLGAGCVFICCHTVKRTQYDNAYIQLAEIYYPAAHAQLDESNEEQSHNSWGTNSAEDNIKRRLPKKTEGNAPKQSKNIYKPKNGKKNLEKLKKRRRHNACCCCCCYISTGICQFRRLCSDCLPKKAYIGIFI